MMIFKKKTRILLLPLLFIGCTNIKITTQKPRPSEVVPPVPFQSTATPESVAATEDKTTFSKGDMTMISLFSLVIFLKNEKTSRYLDFLYKKK